MQKPAKADDKAVDAKPAKADDKAADAKTSKGRCTY